MTKINLSHKVCVTVLCPQRCLAYILSCGDFFFPAPKPMQDGWGGGGEELNLSGGQWDAEEGDMWNSTASQESNSSCNSWGNASKKVPQKV